MLRAITVALLHNPMDQPQVYKATAQLDSWIL